MFGNKLLKGLAAAAVLTVMAGGAHAAPVACGTLAPDVTNSVTVNSGCLALFSADVDNDSNAAVAGMFGVAGWDQKAKINFPKDYAGGILSSNSVLTLTGNTLTGGWTISASVFAAWEKVMLVFKGGDKALPDAVIAYLITGSSVTGATGAYSSPFFDEEIDKKTKVVTYKMKGISHVSLYAAKAVLPPPPVPVPAAGFLLLGALGGLAALRRRRKAV